VFVPREDRSWDGVILKAVSQIRQGEVGPGIRALQDVVDNFSTSRVLRGLPDKFGPGNLIDGQGDIFSMSSQGNPGIEARVPRRINRRIIRPNRLYLPVAEVARQLLAGLSPEGIRIYREIYDSLAEKYYRDAMRTGDRRLLRRVAENYFLTSAGNRARDQLGEMLFRECKLWSALHQWRSILASGSGSPEIQLKVLAALRLLGEKRQYSWAFSRFRAELRRQAGSDGLAGEEEDDLKRILQLEKDVPFPEVESGVSCVPGSGTTRVPRLPAGSLGLDWKSGFWSSRVPLLKASGLGIIQGFQGQQIISTYLQEPIRSYPFIPTQSQGLIYINGVFDLQRLSASTGRVVPPLYHLPLLDRDLQFFKEESDSFIYSPTMAGSRLNSPSFFPGAGISSGQGQGSRILVSSFISHRVEPQSYRSYEITAEIPTRSLAAFDAETGRLLWQTSGLDLGKNGNVVSFITPALVRENRVFAAGWQQIGYVNAVVVALDLYTGAVLWHQLLASNQLEMTMFGEMGREPFAGILAEREGVVYCTTNLGVVAALDGSAGNILWLTTYENIEVEAAEGRRSPQRDIVWSANPPLLIGDTLIVTPRDSMYLYALDLGAERARSWRQPGRILWSYRNSGNEVRDLLGYSGGYLYFTGPAGVKALDIQNVPPGGSPRPVPSTIRWGREVIDGRGALTDAGVLVLAAEGGDLVDDGVGGESRLWLVDLSLKNRTCLSGPLHGKWGLRGPQVSREFSNSRPHYIPFTGNVTVLPGSTEFSGQVLLTSRKMIASFSPRPTVMGDAPTGRAER